MKRLIFIHLLLLFLFSFEVYAEESLWKRETLFGDVLNLRSALAKKGFEFEFVYSGEVMANVSGGLNRGAKYLDNVDLTMTVSLEEFIGWKGATFHVYGLGNYGGSPSDLVGDTQAVSNIDSPNAWRLYQLWLEQNLFEDHVAVLLGLLDLNSEFDYTETGSVFLHSSHGIGAEYAASGQNGPSIFPFTSLAVRVKIAPLKNKNYYLKTAVFDAVPGDLNRPNATAIKWDSSEGFLLSSEIGYENYEEENRTRLKKLALGTWIYTAKFDDVLKTDNTGNPKNHRGNLGIYGLIDYQVYQESGDDNQGLYMFGRFGYANPNFNVYGYYLGAGIVYKGLIPSRDEDDIGLGIAMAIHGSPYKTAQRNAGSAVKFSETNLELVYSAKVLPWLTIKPDVQYVIYPSGNGSINNAFVMGTRFELSL